MAVRPRFSLVYRDEQVRERFYVKAQSLLEAALQDPEATSMSAQLARRALRYRNIINDLEDVDPHDPTFDVSAFLGVEWLKAVESP